MEGVCGGAGEERLAWRDEKRRTMRMKEERGKEGKKGRREKDAPSLKSFSTRFGVPTATPTCVSDMYLTCSASLKCC